MIYVGIHHVFNYKLKNQEGVQLHIVFGMKKESYVMIRNAQIMIMNMIVNKCHFVLGLNINA